jgi:cyclic pyranopterin phosphate synthase
MELSHIDSAGKATMVDVGHKPPQRRVAKARGTITLAPATVALIRDNQIKKGDVLTVAQLAGISAAKQTSSLIPLCHPLMVDKIDVQLTLGETGVVAESTVACVGRTGVEMEALTAVSGALLGGFVMCKAVDKTLRIGGVELLEKTKEDLS